MLRYREPDVDLTGSGSKRARIIDGVLLTVRRQNAGGSPDDSGEGNDCSMFTDYTQINQRHSDIPKVQGKNKFSIKTV